MDKPVEAELWEPGLLPLEGEVLGQEGWQARSSHGVLNDSQKSQCGLSLVSHRREWIPVEVTVDVPRYTGKPTSRRL